MQGSGHDGSRPAAAAQRQRETRRGVNCSINHGPAPDVAWRGVAGRGGVRRGSGRVSEPGNIEWTMCRWSNEAFRGAKPRQINSVQTVRSHSPERKKRGGGGSGAGAPGREHRNTGRGNRTEASKTRQVLRVGPRLTPRHATVRAAHSAAGEFSSFIIPIRPHFFTPHSAVSSRPVRYCREAGYTVCCIRRITLIAWSFPAHLSL